MPDPIQLPNVEHVTGLYFNGDVAELQFTCGEKHYTLRFPLEEIFKSEDWLHFFASELGSSARRAKGSPFKTINWLISRRSPSLR